MVFHTVYLVWLLFTINFRDIVHKVALRLEIHLQKVKVEIFFLVRCPILEHYDVADIINIVHTRMVRYHTVIIRTKSYG